MKFRNNTRPGLFHSLTIGLCVVLYLFHRQDLGTAYSSGEAIVCDVLVWGTALVLSNWLGRGSALRKITLELSEAQENNLL